ncbi:MAG: PP2C family serine/threonine-protein phosphatase [Anaerolineales bacterium]
MTPLSKGRGDRPSTRPLPGDRSGPPAFHVGIGHNIGRVRSTNEDSLIAITALQQADSTLPYFGLFIVADGMGGHELGERASRLAAQTFAREVMGQFGALWLGGSPGEEQVSIQEMLQNAMRKANQSVLRHFPGSGTTLTACLVFTQQVFLAHIGDSRAYFVKEGLHQISHDHSLVQRLIDVGQISPEEATRYAQRNVLLRAIGQTDDLEPEIVTYPWQPGARLLLCSDGLWGAIPEKEILDTIHKSPSVQAACTALVDLCNAAGGPDNISAVLVEMTGGE